VELENALAELRREVECRTRGPVIGEYPLDDVQRGKECRIDVLFQKMREDDHQLWLKEYEATKKQTKFNRSIEARNVKFQYFQVI